MSKKGLIILTVAAFAVIAILVAVTVFRPSGRRSENEPPIVAATIFPLYDIARHVGAGVVDVKLILPANAEPHTFEPTPDAMKSIASARAVYAVGHGLDAWVRPLADASNVPTVTLDLGVALRPADGSIEGVVDGYDPHYWLAAANAKIMAGTVAHDLTDRFPNQAAVIAKNLIAYGAELDRADAEVRRLLANLPDRRLATFHGAYGYFAAAYGLEVAATFEPFPGREPTPRYLADLSTKVKAMNLKVIYHELAFNAAAVQTFATENNLTLGELDDLGGAPGRMSLEDILVYDAQSIANHQR